MQKKNVSKDTLSKSKTDEEVTRAFTRLNAALHTLSSRVSVDTKLSLSEIVANEHLRLDGPLTPKELAGRVQMGSGATTALIDRLEARGFARRVPHPSDRRSLLVEYVAQPAPTLAKPLALQDRLGRRWDALSDEQKVGVLAFLEGVAADIMDLVRESE
jgi:DNA-binding MarR family transcriptional regulator